MKKTIGMLLALTLLGGTMTPITAQQTPSCNTAEYRQFDFWLGNWEVFDYSTGKKGEFAGTNNVVQLYGGCAIQENWVGAGGDIGTSLNSYFNLDQKWHQTWVDNSGYRLEIAGVFKDGKMILEGTHPGRAAGVTVLNRISWNTLSSPKEVRQLWERSRDAGKTWEVLFDGLYLKK
jgi:hypothetical protein